MYSSTRACGENIQPPNGSSFGTPSTPTMYGLGTPFSGGMGTPCHLDYDPIESNITAMSTVNLSAAAEERDVPHCENRLSPCSSSLSAVTKKPLQLAGAHLLVRSPRSTQKRVQTKQSLNTASETMTTHLRPLLERSPHSHLKPVNHLLVASPPSVAFSGSPGRGRPEWRSPLFPQDLGSPNGAHRSVIPASPLTGTRGQQCSPRHHRPVAAASLRLPGPVPASPLTSTRHGPTSEQGGRTDTSGTDAAPQRANDVADKPTTGESSRQAEQNDLSTKKPLDRERDAEDADADDVSVTSQASDAVPGELDAPSCSPEELDLPCSNRHVAYPHLESPVLGDSRQHTRYGEVRFTVFPAIRFARDPKDRRRRLAYARRILREIQQEKTKSARGMPKVKPRDRAGRFVKRQQP